jgi:hypothetical protein
MSNPFTEIKAALRGYLAAHWTAMADDNPAKVRVANRGGVIFRKGQQFADNPAVDTRRVEIREANTTRTSTSGGFVVVYELGYRSDERKTDDDIEVAAKASDEKLGLAYVNKVRVEAARQSVAATEMTNEGQWSGVATLVIEFTKPRTEILPS